jgi:hypothetical protein
VTYSTRNLHLMKSIWIACTLLLAIASPTRADQWTKEDIILEATWEVLHMVDWGTTRNITKEEDNYYEHNPIIGSHPSTSQVDTYMALCALLHPVITRLLRKKARTFGLEWHPRGIWQAISISVSATCVVNNYSIGLTMRFD